MHDGHAAVRVELEKRAEAARAARVLVFVKSWRCVRSNGRRQINGTRRCVVGRARMPLSNSTVHFNDPALAGSSVRNNALRDAVQKYEAGGCFHVAICLHRENPES